MSDLRIKELIRSEFDLLASRANKPICVVGDLEDALDEEMTAFDLLFPQYSNKPLLVKKGGCIRKLT